MSQYIKVGKLFKGRNYMKKYGHQDLGNFIMIAITKIPVLVPNFSKSIIDGP